MIYKLLKNIKSLFEVFLHIHVFRNLYFGYEKENNFFLHEMRAKKDKNFS